MSKEIGVENTCEFYNKYTEKKVKGDNYLKSEYIFTYQLRKYK